MAYKTAVSIIYKKLNENSHRLRRSVPGGEPTQRKDFKPVLFFVFNGRQSKGMSGMIQH
ncbi:hypothetical protein NIASO_12635 [Niabella soli DSM 19437]|uniref:Uncharacterized protein n=1 Tax=Niabella soli DSM 19437 TaxID=929713 RepID=W0F7C5_9BACT|nr:hypothetical protein NIASO_12635 [Niabella soli DSM 19437]